VPPPDVLDALSTCRGRGGGRALHARDQWHVTLRFFGSCAVEDAQAAFAMIQAEPAVAEIGPAVARLGRTVAVVPVHGLEALAAAVTAATSEVGDPPDPRPFTGHLTIARLRHRPACRWRGTRSGPFRVNEVHLVRSLLDPDGARYETVATLGLAPTV
jgi:2'-5' RNA ligase